MTARHFREKRKRKKALKRTSEKAKKRSAFISLWR